MCCLVFAYLSTADDKHRLALHLPSNNQASAALDLREFCFWIGHGLVFTDPVGEFVARSTYRNFFFCSSFARTIFRLAEDGSSCQSKADKAGLQSIINRGAKVLQPAVAGFGRPRLARYFRFSDRSVANLMFHLSSWGPVRTQTQTDVGTCGSRSFSNPRIPSSMHRRLPHHDDDARHLNLPGPCARSCDRPCQRPANMLAGPTSSQ